MDDPRKDARLGDLTPEMRAQTAAVFERMRGMGYEAHLLSGEAVAAHSAGEAVRIGGRCLGREGPGKRFWLHLGAACLAAKLRWGGFEGLSAAHHGALRRALVAGDFDKAMSMKLGTDPARCEIVEQGSGFRVWGAPACAAGR